MGRSTPVGEGGEDDGLTITVFIREITLNGVFIFNESPSLTLVKHEVPVFSKFSVRGMTSRVNVTRLCCCFIFGQFT